MSGPISAHGLMEFPGAHSPVRFASDKPLEFIVRTSHTAGDPNAQYHLRKLESGKKNRKAVLGRSYLLGASANSSNLITFDYSRYGKDSVKITVMLGAGEYALAISHGESAFCFGVD